MSAVARVEYLNTYAPGRVFDPYNCAAQPASGSGGNSTKYCLQSRFYASAAAQLCPPSVLHSSTTKCTTAGQQQLAAFLVCAETKTASGLSSFSTVLPCAHTHFAAADVAAIIASYDPSNVAYDSPPLKVIDAIGNATDVADPKVAYFPDVRVNGKQIKGTPTRANVLARICAEYKGASKPAACKK